MGQRKLVFFLKSVHLNDWIVSYEITYFDHFLFHMIQPHTWSSLNTFFSFKAQFPQNEGPGNS